MDEETCQVTLSSMMERISRLENDLRELRQLVLLQKPYLGISVHKPLTISTKSDLHSPTVAGRFLGGHLPGQLPPPLRWT